MNWNDEGRLFSRPFCLRRDGPIAFAYRMRDCAAGCRNRCNRSKLALRVAAAVYSHSRSPAPPVTMFRIEPTQARHTPGRISHAVTIAPSFLHCGRGRRRRRRRAARSSSPRRPPRPAAAPAAAGPFALPPLTYPANALEPHIDAKTMEIHHGRHHAAYVGNLNTVAKANPQLGTSKPSPTCSATSMP